MKDRLEELYQDAKIDVPKDMVLTYSRKMLTISYRQKKKDLAPSTISPLRSTRTINTNPYHKLKPNSQVIYKNNILKNFILTFQILSQIYLINPPTANATSWIILMKLENSLKSLLLWKNH